MRPLHERRYWPGEEVLGLDGFRVLELAESPDELVVTIETTATTTGYSACRTRALAHERKTIAIRDLACFGRPDSTGADQAAVAWLCPEGSARPSQPTRDRRMANRPRLLA